MNLQKLAILITSLVGTTAWGQAETWTGNGVLFSADGSLIRQYTLKVTNQTEEDSIKSTVVVSLKSGRTETYACRISDKGKSWKSQCDQGNGGGYWFGDGLGQSYLENEEGRAFATTIVKDNETMRLLRTELLHGEAQRFFRERLVKTPKT